MPGHAPPDPVTRHIPRRELPAHPGERGGWARLYRWIEQSRMIREHGIYDAHRIDITMHNTKIR